VYDALGDQPRALEYYNQALPLRRAVGDRSGEATTLNNMGGVYDALGDQPRALEYYNQALPLRRAVGDRSGEATTCYNIGMVYFAQGDLNTAIRYLERTVELDEQIQHPDLDSDRQTLEQLKAMQIKQRLLEIYLQQGEDALRQFLRDRDVPAEQIEAIIADLKRDLDD
jgi:tetratricopeptide (TPR) repeat protein